jgi:hypothetical protein
MFAAIAIVLGLWLVVFVVALWAFPVEDNGGFFIELLIDILDPLLDAFEMH